MQCLYLIHKTAPVYNDSVQLIQLCEYNVDETAVANLLLKYETSNIILLLVIIQNTADLIDSMIFMNMLSRNMIIQGEPLNAII